MTRARTIVFELQGGALLVLPDDAPHEIVFRGAVLNGGSNEHEIDALEAHARRMREAGWRVQQKREAELERLRRAEDRCRELAGREV